MKKILYIIPIAAIFAVALSSCKGKKNSDVIITKMQKVEKRNDTLSMQPYDSELSREWMGNKYKIIVQRNPDTSLPLTKDEQGQKYYDNKISVKVVRADGSTFFNRVFTKSDFRQFLTKGYADDGALLGIVLDKVDGKKLVFGASVGSPEKTSDEYVPMVLTISNFGEVSIAKDTQLDTSSDGEYSNSEDLDPESAAANDL